MSSQFSLKDGSEESNAFGRGESWGLFDLNLPMDGQSPAMNFIDPLD